ncbi:hypothetical protein CHS0354_025802 [Potamilus streckersoni]|uniref:Metal-dependent HD superfamily phosphohydrolase n=1 Tax=Potamilus streckersoni TaxID=2493646 RepID=A0AAE0WBP5_9BIVA|nr:hypothetical protein CHS0354_025802 [Potamilus streckersoni]
MMSSLQDMWLECNMNLGMQENLATKWWSVIREKYSEAHRAYHTLAHLEEILRNMEQCKVALQEPELVSLTVFFHDIIYEPKATDNEEKSAELFDNFAAEELQLKFPEGCLKVKEWILATKTHKTEVHMTPDLYRNDDLHYFLDLDMAVLGRDPRGYQEYASQIRQEYHHLSEGEFCTGRAKVLKKFLAVPNIYATKFFRDRLEQRARENISMEIKKLEQSITS